MRKAWLETVAVAALSCFFALTYGSTCGAVGTATLVVMQTNPNGVPAVGNQYLLGIQVAGIATPSFLGSNLINFTGGAEQHNDDGSWQLLQRHEGVVSIRIRHRDER